MIEFARALGQRETKSYAGRYAEGAFSEFPALRVEGWERIRETVEPRYSADLACERKPRNLGRGPSRTCSYPLAVHRHDIDPYRFMPMESAREQRLTAHGE